DFPFNEFIDPSTFSLAVGTVIIVPDGVMPAEKPWSAPKPKIIIPQESIAGTSGQLIWPVGGQISQNYVWYHKGIDIANKAAPDVAAAEGGRVAYVAKERVGYGWHVILDHGNGLQTLYAHLRRIDVNVGDSVSRGQIIGEMGSTGRSTGTHLHFEVRKNGAALNPFGFLK
ncbi:MAG: M23 family metallopeptidase, partial [bacterium]|nr:M23 family metallopeptidase [bacterium]